MKEHSVFNGLNRWQLVNCLPTALRPVGGYIFLLLDKGTCHQGPPRHVTPQTALNLIQGEKQRQSWGARAGRVTGLGLLSQSRP